MSNQSTKLLVLLVASLVGFSIITGNPLLVLSAFFVLAISSAVVAFAIRVLRFLVVSVHIALLATQAQKQPVRTQNQRVVTATPSNVVRKLTGDYIADAPAYVRKAQGYCYPITKEVLNNRNFTIMATSTN